MFRLITATLSLGLLALVAPAASAQCPVPDGLDGPCWQPVTPNLPQFPSVEMPGTGICWDQCTALPQQCVRVDLGVPNQSACGAYSANLIVRECLNGDPVLRGSARLDYTRTWEEERPTNPPTRVQVYRFTLKVDLTPSTVVPPDPCIVPSCLGQWPQAFYYGYVDYARDCATGTFETAVVLYHACDNFIHRPGLSDRPGAFHPNRSFAIVAPSSAVNPFVANNAQAATGPMVAEAMRNVPQLPGQLCIAEERLAQGTIDFVGEGCGCTLAQNPDQITARRFGGSGTCTVAGFGPSTFVSVNTTPNFPWFHGMTTSIGEWTTDVGYPGKEQAWVDEVPMLYRDSCANAAFGEVYYGGTTDAGWVVVPLPGMVASQRFTDLASNASFSLPGGPLGPFVGSVLPTRNLIYVNTP